MNEKEGLIDLLIHDLVGPLAVSATSATNLLHKAERYGPLTDQQRRVLERVLRNVKKAQTLVQDMVEISRSKEGFFQKELFSVKEVVEESLLDALESTSPDVMEKLGSAPDPKGFEGILESHGIFTEIKGKYCQSPFCHDQRKVCQILRNLMSNALKYRHRRMEVSISGDVDLLVAIEDDGQGIPKEELEAVFKRFYRIKGNKHSERPGLGLGLAGVKVLVEAMGGEISLESREGAGTRFRIKIPPL